MQLQLQLQPSPLKACGDVVDRVIGKSAESICEWLRFLVICALMRSRSPRRYNT